RARRGRPRPQVVRGTHRSVQRRSVLMDELDGKVAVVTGAASGIGLALCECFADEGMRVVMADVEPTRLAAAADELRAESGADVLAVAGDVSSWDDVEALATATVERFGAADVLCNNAGVTKPGLPWELTHEQWEWLVGVNLW